MEFFFFYLRGINPSRGTLDKFLTASHHQSPAETVVTHRLFTKDTIGQGQSWGGWEALSRILPCPRMLVLDVDLQLNRVGGVLATNYFQENVFIQRKKEPS